MQWELILWTVAVLFVVVGIVVLQGIGEKKKEAVSRAALVADLDALVIKLEKQARNRTRARRGRMNRKRARNRVKRIGMTKHRSAIRHGLKGAALYKAVH